jgi:ABC-type lipopolysaccharide export system ATPase subunit
MNRLALQVPTARPRGANPSLIGGTCLGNRTNTTLCHPHQYDTASSSSSHHALDYRFLLVIEFFVAHRRRPVPLAAARDFLDEKNTMSGIIRTEGISKKYGRLVALDEVSFAVQQGEIFGYLGPNGAGKTTTVHMLTGLCRPTSGEAFVNGYSIVRETVRAKASVGVVPETSNLYGELTAWENLIYMAQLYGLPKGDWALRTDALLGQFGLEERKESRFQSLSRGMKRRLTIAAALVHHPRLIFLDEPTAGLDVISA